MYVCTHAWFLSLKGPVEKVTVCACVGVSVDLFQLEVHTGIRISLLFLAPCNSVLWCGCCRPCTQWMNRSNSLSCRRQWWTMRGKVQRWTWLGRWVRHTHTHTQTVLMMTYAYVCTYVCTYMHVDCVAVILIKVSYSVCLLTHYLATLPPSSCSGWHPRLCPGWLRRGGGDGGRFGKGLGWDWNRDDLQGRRVERGKWL